MSTVPSGTISISDLSAAFGLPNNLAAYYGVRWFKENNSRGYFQAAGNPISLTDFAGTRNTSPVSPNYAIYYGSQNITIPMFNNLTVTVKGGDGGTHGQGGNCDGGGDGGAGGDSYLSGYVSAGGGGINGGTGATASTSLSITDANQSSIIARYGTQPYGQVGGGGGAGRAGAYTNYYFQCDVAGFAYGVPVCLAGHNYGVCNGGLNPGGGGAAGYIRLDWS